jgi:hypothetical protein
MLPRAGVHDAAIAVAVLVDPPTQVENVHQEEAEDLLMRNGTTVLNKRIQR